jgi:hypothetical protein
MDAFRPSSPKATKVLPATLPLKISCADTHAFAINHRNGSRLSQAETEFRVLLVQSNGDHRRGKSDKPPGAKSGRELGSLD